MEIGSDVDYKNDVNNENFQNMNEVCNMSFGTFIQHFYYLR